MELLGLQSSRCLPGVGPWSVARLGAREERQGQVLAAQRIADDKGNVRCRPGAQILQTDIAARTGIIQAIAVALDDDGCSFGHGIRVALFEAACKACTARYG